jgi:hypothetical protein
MQAFYWLLANIIGPVLLAPLIISLSGITGTSWTTIKGRLVASISDGQLFWVAIGIAATGAYDAGVTAFVDHQGHPVATHFIFFVQLAVVGLSSLIVCLVSVKLFQYEEQFRAAVSLGQPLPTKNMGSTMHVSILATIVVASLSTALKFAVAA